MAQIRERSRKDGSKSYLARIRLQGYPDVTATFGRLTDAKRWVQMTEVDLRSGIYLKTAEAKKHTLAQTIDRYIKDVLSHRPETLKSNKSQLSFWRDNLGDLLLADLSSARIVEIRDQLANELTVRKTKRSPARVNRYLAALSSVLTTASREWEWMDDNPLRKVSKLKEPKGRVRYLNDEEREALLQAAKESGNKHLYLALVMALSTGARRKEIWDLSWRDVDLKRGFLSLLKTKNGEVRTVPIQGLGLELLRNHSKLRRLDTDLLFPSQRNPKRSMDFRVPFEKALDKAGIEDFTWHDLRHSCASYLAMNGAPMRTIAEILGHKSLAMVHRYSHLSPEHLKDAVSGMNEKIFG